MTEPRGHLVQAVACHGIGHDLSGLERLAELAEELAALAFGKLVDPSTLRKVSPEHLVALVDDEALAMMVVFAADKDAGVRWPPLGIARLLQRLPRGLKEDPLLRIHGDRLAGRDPEEERIEVVGL